MRGHALWLSLPLSACLLLPLRPDCCVAAEPESDDYDAIVEAFIQYDIGRCRGKPGQIANRRFQSISTDEAIAALVRGVNRSARLRQSCPICVISAKLQQLMQTTSDPKKLQYAVDHLDSTGSGVVYATYVDRLRQFARLRLDQLNGVAPREPVFNRALRGGTPGQLRRSRMAIRKWSYQDLQEAVDEEKATELVQVLEELQQRKGSEFTELLAGAIARLKDESTKEVARGLLARRLTRMTERTLQAKLQDRDPEVRAAAARAVGYKGVPLYEELVEALRDRDPMVATEAHAVLVKLSGEDFGPPANASGVEWFEAGKRWQQWLQERGTSGD